MNDALLNTEITSRAGNERLRGARAEVRTEKARPRQFEPYRPRGIQDIPPALLNKMTAEGYHLHWVRVTIDGEMDSENLAEVAHKGYEPVQIQDVPENILKTLKISDVAGFKGLIVSKDSALFKIPESRFQEIRKYYQDIADMQLRGVNDQIRQNASVHGLEVKLYDESRSKVSRGENSRQVMAQDDAPTDSD